MKEIRLGGIFKFDKINKDFIYEWVFIIFLCIGISNYYKNSHRFMAISGIVIVMLLNIINYYKKEKGTIYCNKKAIFTFIFVYILTLYQNKIAAKLITFLASPLKSIFIQIIIIIVPILTCYLFKIRLRDFKWKCSFKWILIAVFLFGIILIPRLYCDGVWILKYKYYSIDAYIINVANALIFNAGFEELVFRGFALASIKSFRISDTKANIIQAMLFGALHLYAVSSLSGICWHILNGYIFGEIYLNSKSLTPGILLHLLVNWV